MRFWKFQRWMVLALVLILMLPVANVQAKSSKPPITITLDGNPVASDVAPYIIPKVYVTMVPLGVISEGLGANVNWEQTTKTVTINQNGSSMSLTNGKKTAQVNGATLRSMLPSKSKTAESWCRCVLSAKTWDCRCYGTKRRKTSP
ncbi:hypothetical protein CM49_05246 [Paenibacillus sp. P1XP2]|nr:hypothetical protein CM49_05246 [Paenibacillus sp. P1XP2]